MMTRSSDVSSAFSLSESWKLEKQFTYFQYTIVLLFYTDEQSYTESTTLELWWLEIYSRYDSRVEVCFILFYLL